MLDPRDGLECDRCGGTAIRPDFAGAYEQGAGGRCAECGCPGWVDHDFDGAPLWVTDESDAVNA